MKIIALLITLFLTIINVHTAQADIIKYNVTETFHNAKGNFTADFTGTFTYDSTAKSITNLQGTLNDTAMGVTGLVLTNQLPTQSSTLDGSGGLLASVYLLGNSSLAPNGGNASATIEINPNNPLLGPIDSTQLSYTDCTTGGMMGSSCMVGNANNGLMGVKIVRNMHEISSPSVAIKR